MRPCVTIVATAAALIGGGTAQARGPRFDVAPVRSEWDGARNVGKRRAGAICAVAGSIAWRDVTPDPAAAADRIARAMKAAGADVMLAGEVDDAAAPRYRFTARIVDLHIDACNPHFGTVKMLGGGALKGHGSMTMAWTLHDRTSRSDADPVLIDTGSASVVRARRSPKRCCRAWRRTRGALQSGCPSLGRSLSRDKGGEIRRADGSGNTDVVECNGADVAADRDREATFE